MKYIKYPIIAIILAALAFAFYFYYKISPVGSGQEKILTIERGQSLNAIAVKLYEEKLIKSAFYFKLAAKIKRCENKIKFGEYKISPKNSAIQILNQIVEGRIYMHLVTIPEGFTIEQIAQRLSKENIVDKEEFLVLAKNNTNIEINGYTPPTLEGYLFPDSYFFPKGLTAAEVISTFINKFKEKIIPLYEEAKKQNNKLMSLDDIIKLASIVEAEAKLDKERPVIASVYYNRLNKKILLQCDATIQYVLEKRKINIDYNDLSMDTPYNTYLYPGLPPTPIGNPGTASVNAVLFPAKTQYLYFVRNDKAGDGSHIFSKTYEEHLKAIDKYQIY